MKTVILCGGRGLRLTGSIPSLPKALVEIGGRPILWHIMKTFAHFGLREFVLCLGYLGDAIETHFAGEAIGDHRVIWRDTDGEQFDITFAHTGEGTPSGERVLRVRGLLEDDPDFLTAYCDGLWNGNPHHLLQFHRSLRGVATLTAVRPDFPFGVLDMDDDGRVWQFREKPRMDQWINGGFLAFDRRVFDYLRPGDELEKDLLTRLSHAGEMWAFRHTGFWQCMDTYKETQWLNAVWESGKVPWKVWESGGAECERSEHPAR